MQNPNPTLPNISINSCAISFQLFTIYSVALVLLMFLDYFRIIPYNALLSERKLDIELGVVIMLLFFFAGINAIFYYIWDVVKSAYKQIKDENIANSYPDAYPMNVVTYQKPTTPLMYNQA